MVAPFLLAFLIEPALTHVVLERAPLVGEVRELHRLDDTFDNHRRAEQLLFMERPPNQLNANRESSVTMRDRNGHRGQAKYIGCL